MAEKMMDKNVAESENEIKGNGKTQINSIQLKRQVTVKSVVTESFRSKAKGELADELKLIESQLEQLENQYQATLKQIEDMAKMGQNVSMHLEQLNREAQEKRNQLANVKMQVATNLANLDRVQNGDMVVTGVLENFVEVKLGDNIYEMLRGSEVIIEDGVVKSILG
jgi:uncharacterized protein involved in exopolysaccharide biosynthesis